MSEQRMPTVGRNRVRKQRPQTSRTSPTTWNIGKGRSPHRGRDAFESRKPTLFATLAAKLWATRLSRRQGSTSVPTTGPDTSNELRQRRSPVACSRSTEKRATSYGETNSSEKLITGASTIWVGGTAASILCAPLSKAERLWVRAPVVGRSPLRRIPKGLLTERRRRCSFQNESVRGRRPLNSGTEGSNMKTHSNCSTRASSATHSRTALTTGKRSGRRCPNQTLRPKTKSWIASARSTHSDS